MPRQNIHNCSMNPSYTNFYREEVKDDDFRHLVNRVPQGCRMTIISDSCQRKG
ncbi:hypothetical protein Bca4012_027402 [Brassica carinata]